MGDACTHCSILNRDWGENYTRVISNAKTTLKTENSKTACIHIIKISYQINI